MITLIIIGLLLLVAFTTGFRNYTSLHVHVLIKSFKHPFFMIGLNSVREVYKDRIIDVITIALFFFIIEFEFTKPLSDNIYE
jgi:hypothetical protein